MWIEMERKSMRVVVIHPLKHHVYYSMAGVMKSGVEVEGLFGYYDKNDLLDQLVKKTKWKKQIEGYKYDKISNCVKTNIIVKMLFLLAKAKPQFFQALYDWVFENWVIYNLNNVDCIHVLQDYENKVIRYAKKHKIKIVYEQIIAFDMNQYIMNPSIIENDSKLLKEKENLYSADFIITGSDFVKKSIDDRINDSQIYNKIAVIPYGADTSKFTYRERVFDGERTLKLIIVAFITERKGFKYLLDAMEMLKNYDIKLSVIGKSNSEELSLFKRFETMDNVEYIGVVPHEHMNDYYADADIFVLPSLAEGSSLSVYEALASGLPCIVTNNTGSVVRNGYDGIIVETKDAESIALAIKKFLNKPELVKAMSKNASNTIMKYTWEHYENEISSIYKKRFERSH